MRSVGFILDDPAMPRTVFYDRFLDAVRRHRSFSGPDAELLIPAEDTANETNWPRYGNPDSAYIRGTRAALSADNLFANYLESIAAFARVHPEKRMLIVNMHPFPRLPLTFRTLANVIVADGSLAEFERAFNPRTISMPALPLAGAANANIRRDVLASFQGAASHPVRQWMARLHNGKDFIVRLVDPAGYARRIDAINAVTDPAYEALLDRSVFAFVPRGDALFSCRLLETMARGAIPLVLSDGWVLPFDRIADWPACALRFHQEAVPRIPEMLRALTRHEIETLQQNGRVTYARLFKDMDTIVAALFEEAQIICR